MGRAIDINEVYNNIVAQLNTTGNRDVVTGLEGAGAGVATGGEYLSATATYLSNLELLRPEAYRLVKELIRDYKKYCRQQGIFVK